MGEAESRQRFSDIVPGGMSADFRFFGTTGSELLRICQDGDVYYQGRLLGTDEEVWAGLRDMFGGRQWFPPQARPPRGARADDDALRHVRLKDEA